MLNFGRTPRSTPDTIPETPPADRVSRRLRDYSPEFASVSDRLAALAAREEQIQLELARLHSFIAAHPKLICPAPESPSPSPLRAALGDHALLAGGPPSDNQKTGAGAYALLQERRAIREAELILRRRLAALSATESPKLCRRLRPEYDATLGRVRDAAEALSEAAKAHDQFLRQVRAGGASPAGLRLLFVEEMHAAVKKWLWVAQRRLARPN